MPLMASETHLVVTAILWDGIFIQMPLWKIEFCEQNIVTAFKRISMNMKIFRFLRVHICWDPFLGRVKLLNSLMHYMKRFMSQDIIINTSDG